MKHFVIIRFNSGNKNLDWVLHRMRYFRAFTAPSLKAQTNKDFTTLLMVDPSTPKDIVEELKLIGIIYTTPSRGTGRILQCELKAHIGPLILSLCEGKKRIVTTRVDSDDGLSKNFIEITQRLVREDTRDKFFVFPKGVMWREDQRKFFLREEPSPPFASRVETTSVITTVLGMNHSALVGKKIPHWIYDKEQMWLQAYHDRNVITKPDGLGKEVPLSFVRQRCGEIELP